MTKIEYGNKYLHMTDKAYAKLTKAELTKVMAELCEGLRNGVQEYCMPSGDSWTVDFEVAKWYRQWFDVKNWREPAVVILNIEENDSRMMWRKKDWLVKYVLTLDMAYASMNEVMHKHPYHDCLDNLRRMMRG